MKIKGMAKIIPLLVVISLVFSLIAGVITITPQAGASPGTKLLVTITPLEDGDIITPGGPFDVTATIKNTGGEDASNVVVTLTLNGYASLPAGDTGVRTFASIGDGEVEEVTWSNITCDTNGDVIITVTASAFNAPEASATVTIHQNSLVVNIERPVTSTIIAVGSTFYVNAVITNVSPEPMEGAQATITITGNASLHPDEGETKDVLVPGQDEGTIPAWSSAEVWWRVDCTGLGDVTIEVEAQATASTGTELEGSDSVTVHQRDVWLVAEIIEPPFKLADGSQRPPDGYSVCESNNFVVKAIITNIHNSTINGVFATITVPTGASLVDDPETWTIGTLAPGKSAEVAWNLHCEEAGSVEITVTPGGSGVSGRVLEDSVTVKQRALEPHISVVISSDRDKVCTGTCHNTFIVTATITNSGCAAATGVSATLAQVDGDGTVTIANPTQTVGTVPGLGGSRTVTWTVTCTGADDVELQVEVDPGDILSNPITVEQCREFVVEITEIARLDGTPQTTFSTEQEFTVTARFTNCRIERSDLRARIDLSNIGAVLAPGSNVTLKFYNAAGELTSTETVPAAETVIIRHLCACCYVDITWQLECINSTDGTISVEAWTATGVPLGDDESDEIAQEWKAHLVSGIGVYPGSLSEGTMETTPSDEVDIGEKFTVVAKVTNIGEAAATDVVVSINVSGAASPSGTMSRTIAKIPGGGSAKAIFELTCTGAGTVTITNPDNPMLALKLEGKDENTGAAIPAANINVVCAVRVTQVAPPPPPGLQVVIIQPVTCTVFNLDDVFAVKALITNTGGATASVTAEIYWEDEDGDPYSGAAPLGGQPLERTIGAILPGATEEVSWVMRCTGMGDVTITVFAGASGYGEVSDSVLIHQVGVPELSVEILSPGNWTYIATSQEFAITAKVYNAGATATGVSVKLEIPEVDEGQWDGEPYATIVSGANPVFVGDLGYGEYEIVSWTVHADSTWMKGNQTAWVTFNVTASATNVPRTDWPEDWVVIGIYPAAHLVVEILAPQDGSQMTVCDEFAVTARIYNTGQADAWEVSATLSVEPQGSARITRGGYTQYVGTLVGWGTGDYADVSWTLHCKEACNSVITVTAQGYDEFGNHLQKVWDVYSSYNYTSTDWYYAMFSEPGRAIESRFIEPDSITVKQVGVPVVEMADLTLSISYPDTIVVGEPFTVIGMVANSGGGAASGVSVTLEAIGPVTPATQTWTVGALAAGAHATHTWTLTPTGTGTVKFILSATGTDAASGTTIRALVDPQVVSGEPAEVQVILPDRIDVAVSPWTWLWAPILIGFVLLGALNYLALRQLASRIGDEIRAKK